MSSALYQAYQRSVQDVQRSIADIHNLERRVRSADAAIQAAVSRSTATQRKARSFLQREKRILDDELYRKEQAIDQCRRVYRQFMAGQWAKAWGLPVELADEVAYYVR